MLQISPVVATSIGAGGGGPVGGAGSGTDNRIARWDGTDLIQDSLWSIADTGLMSVDSTVATLMDLKADMDDLGPSADAMFEFQLDVTTTSNNANKHIGLQQVVIYNSNDQLTNTASGLTSILASVINDGTGTVDNVAVGEYRFTSTKANTTTFARGIRSVYTIGPTATLTEWAAFSAEKLDGGGSATDHYFAAYDNEYADGILHLHVRNNDASGDKSRWIVVSSQNTGLIAPTGNDYIVGIAAASSGDGNTLTLQGSDGGNSGNTDGGNIDIVVGQPNSGGTGTIGRLNITATTDTDPTMTSQLIKATHTLSPSADNAQQFITGHFILDHDNANNLNGSDGVVTVLTEFTSDGTGDVFLSSNIGHKFTTGGAKTVTRHDFVSVLPYIDTATTVSTVVGINFEQENGSGAATNYYAFNIENGWLSGSGINMRRAGNKKTVPVCGVQTTTLGAGAATFNVTDDTIVLTGDGGSNTISTITGGYAGQLITIIFTDGNVTITDDNTHASDTVDLSAAFTGADDTTLTLRYDGTSWYEVSRSVN